MAMLEERANTKTIDKKGTGSKPPSIDGCDRGTAGDVKSTHMPMAHSNCVAIANGGATPGIVLKATNAKGRDSSNGRSVAHVKPEQCNRGSSGEQKPVRHIDDGGKDVHSSSTNAEISAECIDR